MPVIALSGHITDILILIGTRNRSLYLRTLVFDIPTSLVYQIVVSCTTRGKRHGLSVASCFEGNEACRLHGSSLIWFENVVPIENHSASYELSEQPSAAFVVRACMHCFTFYLHAQATIQDLNHHQPKRRARNVKGVSAMADHSIGEWGPTTNSHNQPVHTTNMESLVDQASQEPAIQLAFSQSRSLTAHSTWHTTITSAKENMTLHTCRQQTLNTQRSTATALQLTPWQLMW